MTQIEQINDDILRVLTNSRKPLSLNELTSLLHIKHNSETYIIFRNILTESVDSGIILKSNRRRYSLHDFSSESGLIGIISIGLNKGIVETESRSFPIINIRKKYLSNALDGDKVRIRIHNSKPGEKVFGEVVEIIKRNTQIIIGSIDYDGDSYFLIPDDKKYLNDFYINERDLKNAKDGDKVKVKFISWDDPDFNPRAEVIEIIREASTVKDEYDVLVKKFGFKEKFPDDVEEESNSFEEPKSVNNFKGRLDLTKTTVITIDPDDAKDFDDALSLKTLKNGTYVLGVHIADVSFYAPENSAIDIEARGRGTSVYMTDRVIPMLPERLSNGICSLVPDRLRLAMTVIMYFDQNGYLLKYKIRESIIRSARRFTYNEALEILKNQDGEHCDLIINLQKLSEILRKRRFDTGGIDFHTTEVRFRFDDKGFPVESMLKTSNIATELVEECMLIANKTVAEHIKNISIEQNLINLLPFLYRVHDKPKQKDLREALKFLVNYGARQKIRHLTSKEINELLHSLANTELENIADQILIRSMAKAEYSKQNIGHFGLGFSNYTHFTSPIRRYPDLIVHRLLKEYALGLPTAGRMNFIHILLKNVAHVSSERERIATEAERESVKITQALMCQKQVGREFSGTVTGLTKFGIFVRIDEIFAEGLVRLQEIKTDYFEHDEANYQIVGRNTKETFQFGKRLKVKILRVSLEKRTIDLGYLGSE
ncbi:MAG: ribonuclease R [Candidatus Kapabacteria bacterium]|nr:ribonuclease R [Candidatus Kapabacteria bacterium]